MLIDNKSHRGRINFAQIVVNQDISKTTDGARRAAKVCSYFNRFLEYIFPNMPIQFVLGHHLDGAMKQKGEFFGEGQALLKQIVAGREVHQKVHIAVGPFLSPRHRAKHAYAASAEAAPQCVYGFALSAQLIQQHGSASWWGGER